MGEVTEKDARMWAMFCHLGALIGLVGVPMGNILGPLILWLIKKEEIPSIEMHGKESLNFQLSMTIYSMACVPLFFLCYVGVPLFLLLVIANIILVIMAGLKANEGGFFQYPLTIRFIK